MAIKWFHIIVLLGVAKDWTLSKTQLYKKALTALLQNNSESPLKRWSLLLCCFPSWPSQMASSSKWYIWRFILRWNDNGDIFLICMIGSVIIHWSSVLPYRRWGFCVLGHVFTFTLTQNGIPLCTGQFSQPMIRADRMLVVWNCEFIAGRIQYILISPHLITLPHPHPLLPPQDSTD